MLGERHDPQIGVAGAEVARRLRAVGAPVRRHVDVDDGQIGPLGQPPSFTGTPSLNLTVR